MRSACCSQKKDHQQSVTHEGLSNIYYDPLLGHNDRVCSDFVCPLVKSGSLSFLLDSTCQSGIFCVYKKNLSLRLILDARRSNQHFRASPKATGDSFSRVELLIGNLEEGEALALHIASGDVRNAFHHMGMPERLRFFFCLRPLSARAFGVTGKIVQAFMSPRNKSCFLRHSRCPWVSWSMFFCWHVGLQQANCADSLLGLPIITYGEPPIVLGPNHSLGIRWNYADNLGAV